MEDIGESDDVNKTTKEELSKKESEELFSDVSSMEIAETDGFNSALIEEDGDGFVVEDALSDVSISEILNSNVVLDEAYTDDEVCDEDSHSKVRDDVLSDISSACSMPIDKGKQSSSRKHSPKSHSRATSAAKNKPEGSSDKSQKVDSSRRRHESSNTAVSKASTEKSDSYRSSSNRKFPRGIIPLKGTRDEYRCTVCFCYLASTSIMERHISYRQHRRRAQHIETTDHSSSSRPSREKRKHEDDKESQKSATKVKESSDAKKPKLGATQEGKESLKTATGLKEKKEEAKGTTQDGKESQKAAAGSKEKKEEATSEEEKIVSEKTKDKRKEETSASDKKNQKETLGDVIKVASGNAKEDKESAENAVVEDKKQREVKKEDLVPGKTQENKESQNASVTDKKQGKSATVAVKKEETKSIRDKNKEEISTDTGKPASGKTAESKKGVKVATEKENASAELPGKTKESKENVKVSKENVKVTNEKKQESSVETSGKTEESKGKAVKVTNEKKQESAAESSERNKDRKESQKGKESLKDKDHKESQKDYKDSLKDTSNKEPQNDKDRKESQKIRDPKELQKDKREKENKGPQKVATKGKENSSSTKKPEKRHENKEGKQSNDASSDEKKSGKRKGKEVARDEINSDLKKPKLESESDNKDQKKTEIKGDPRILRHLSDMKQPILGIEDLYLSGSDGNWIYHCRLCSVACGSVDIRHHLLGRRHRTSYTLRYQQKTSTNSVSQVDQKESDYNKAIPAVSNIVNIITVPTVKNDFNRPIPTIKSNRGEKNAPRGRRFRDEEPQLIKVRNFREDQKIFREDQKIFREDERRFREDERRFRENERTFRDEQPFPNERVDDWKQARWNDCCNSFLKITMDREDSPSRDDFDRPLDRCPEIPFRDRFNEDFEFSRRRPLSPRDSRFEMQGPPQFPQPEHISHPPFPHSQPPPDPPHFQEHPPHFQEPGCPPSFQSRQPPHFQDPRGPPNFQELAPPPHFLVPPHLCQSEFPMPYQFPQTEFPIEPPHFQKPVFQQQHNELAKLDDNEKSKKQKNQIRQLRAIPTDDKAAASKPSKDIATVSDDKPAKGSEAARDIFNVMIQDYLKNELQKLPSQLQKILCESTKVDEKSTVSDKEVAKGRNSSSSKHPVESKKRPSETKHSTSQGNKKEANVKTPKRVKPEDVASSFDQHSYRNVENAQTIPFLGVASNPQDSANDKNKINEFSNDTSIIKDDASNSQNDNATAASVMNNCFEQFIKSWIEHTGAVPVRPAENKSLDKSDSKQNIAEENTGETSSQVSPDFSNIDHAELGRQVAAFLSKHSSNWTESIGHMLLKRNPQGSFAPLNNDSNASTEKQMASNTAEIAQYSRGPVPPFIDQNNRGHSVQGMSDHNRDESFYKRAPDNWDDNLRNRDNNPPSQAASYWVASGRDGLPTRIYFDDTAGSYRGGNRIDMARGNVDSMANTYQERRMNIDDLRERHRSDYNRRGRGNPPFRSAHSLSFLDLLHQHRNDPVFSPGFGRSLPRRSYY